MTLPAHDLRVLLDGLGRLGHDVDALLAEAGLRDADFTNPDARVPCEAYGEVLTRAQQARFTPNLALELARVTPLGAWPLLDYPVVTADTIGAGVRQLQRYFHLTGNSSSSTLAKVWIPFAWRSRPRRRSRLNTRPH